MMVDRLDDELEPAGPQPTRDRPNRSRRPEEPARAAQVLRAYAAGHEFCIRRPDEAGALNIKREINSAVYHLNRWEENPNTPGRNYNIRSRPYVLEHYAWNGVEHTVGEPGMPTPPKGADHYWKTYFWVHDPLPRGFKQMDTDFIMDANRNSAVARAKSPKRQGRPRRSVAEGGS
jgi:hypothetical protein